MRQCLRLQNRRQRKLDTDVAVLLLGVVLSMHFLLLKGRRFILHAMHVCISVAVPEAL